MTTSPNNPDYKDRSRSLVAIGVPLLLGGIAAGLIGPIELYTFYLFSEGGRFHYEGFRFGSFMFGNIAAQTIAYYLVAALLIPLGYGHLAMRRWVRPLALALLWSWLVAGAPLLVVAFFLLLASKSVTPAGALIALAVLGLSYLVFPGLLIRFYRGRNVTRTLEVRDAGSYWIENVPTPILVLGCLYAFYIIMLHILILFNGIYPLFGVFRFGREGIELLDVSIAALFCITWGTLRQRLWAWWGSVILFGLFAFSTVFTLAASGYARILAGLAFPPREMEMLGGLPVQGYHFAVMAGIPLLITWVVAVLSKRHFRPGL